MGLTGEGGPWFDYRVEVYPHHTDYAGVTWHGAYLMWMEEARVAYLRAAGVSFAELVGLGCDLPVVELSMRYHRSLGLGMVVLVKTRLNRRERVRLIWDQQIQSLDGHDVYVSAQVTLVAVDPVKKKVLRQLPSPVAKILAGLSTVLD